MKKGRFVVPERRTLEDEEIVDLYWARNELAITETDKKYRSYLYTIAYNMLHDTPDCEECLNDTYFGTWNAIPPTRPAILRLFLAKIMRNTAVDRIRHDTAGRRVPSELVCSLDELDFSVVAPDKADDSVVMEELVKLLNSYLKTLSERNEFIFVCRYYYADPIERIAAMLHISEKTVYRVLADIHRELSELLKEGDGQR
jgi:RNA polymerase sigma-70 factor (ECF subfamily)